MAKARVKFTDNEIIEGEAPDLAIQNMSFVLLPYSGNNQKIFVAMPNVKYIQMPDIPSGHPNVSQDPRYFTGNKLVIRFMDGETLYAFTDQNFFPLGHCFSLAVWDQEEKRLLKTFISVFSIKAIFQVEVWNTETPPELIPPTS